VSAPAASQDNILLCNISDRVATLTLNRPKQFNALSEEMLVALQQALEKIATDDATAVVVIEGQGKAFCAGHDLKQMQLKPEQEYYQSLFKQCSAFMQKLIQLPQPVIAKVNGMATAAGCQLVGACDLAIASDNAQFGVSGINLGLFCSTPSVALSRNISRKRAFEMLFTGEFIDATQAMEWGLVNQAVSASQLDATVDALCEKILRKPRIAVRTGKTMFYQQIEKDLEDAYAYAGEIMACNMMDDVTSEGISAFIDKRPPAWREG